MASSKREDMSGILAAPGLCSQCGYSYMLKGVLKVMLTVGVYAGIKAVGEQTLVANIWGRAGDLDMNANCCCCPPLQSPFVSILFLFWAEHL